MGRHDLVPCLDEINDISCRHVAIVDLVWNIALLIFTRNRIPA